jgi:hypothetical protein
MLRFIILILLYCSCSAVEAVEENPPVEDEKPKLPPPPCLTASINCQNMISFGAEGSKLNFNFYSSYDITNQDYYFPKITTAIIVVHGAGRDSDEYFRYLTDVIKLHGKQEQVLIISPSFKISSEAASNELFWSQNGWRAGNTSNNNTTTNYSSFTIVDALVDLLKDEKKMPELKNIIVTGHSSGALFTHLYASGNRKEEAKGKHTYSYIVANSQYFFYPGPQRYNRELREFTIPDNCPGYQNWPYGLNNLNSYMKELSPTAIVQQFLERKVFYLLGNQDIVTTGSLNTNDCAATLLGIHRFDRGNKMYEYLETFYKGTHNHSRFIVPGVGHSGEEMYKSTQFQNLIKTLY